MRVKYRQAITGAGNQAATPKGIAPAAGSGGVAGYLHSRRHQASLYKQCHASGTGQRLGDIANVKFADIWDDMLHVKQEKTGSRLAIPLSIRCDALDTSLREVVAKCRDVVISKYLVHFRHATSQAPRGGQVSTKTLTSAFKKARDKSGLKLDSGTEPTFHEQRSLSERLYRQQGIDTQKLLGHRTSQMTDKYNDERGKDWVIIGNKTG